MSQTAEYQIQSCLQRGELISHMQRACPPEVFWLFEFLFPQMNIRFSDSGQFNLLEIIESVTGPAEYAKLCAIKGNVIDTGQTLSLETVTAPMIYEEMNIAVCDADSLVLNPITGKAFTNFKQKVDYLQARNAAVFVKRLRKRLEINAVELLKDGKITIDGPNIEATEIDFGRDPNNTVDIMANAKIDNPLSEPLDMFSDIDSQVFDCESEGNVDIIFSPAGAKALRKNQQIKDIFKLQANAGQCVDCLLDMSIFPQHTKVIGQERIGSFGRFTFWEWNRKIQLPDGSEIGLEEKDAYMVKRDAFNGIRGFGSIKNMVAPMIHRETAYMDAKVKKHGIKQEMQSRPLPIPGNINATAVLRGIIS